MTDPIEAILDAYRVIEAEIDDFIDEERALGRKISISVLGTKAAANPAAVSTLKRATLSQGGATVRAETLRKLRSYIQDQRAARSPEERARLASRRSAEERVSA